MNGLQVAFVFTLGACAGLAIAHVIAWAMFRTVLGGLRRQMESAAGDVIPRARGPKGPPDPPADGHF